MRFDDFDTQIQADEWPEAPEEINPEEYDDWVAYCARGYEASEREAHDLSEEIDPNEYDDWLQSIGVTPEEFEADMKAQDRWYHETFEDVVWSDFLEQMTYAND